MPLQPLIRTACDRLARATRALVVVLAVVMLVALTLQVVMRYVFNRPLSWSEELAVTCFGWSMLLALGLGVRDAIHARMDLFVDCLPAPWRAAVDRLVSLAIAFSGAFIAWSGLAYMSDTGGMTSAAIGYPLGWLYACAPACGVLVTIFGLEQALLGPPAESSAPLVV
jgi:TRAP-type C4-dicarboxylate transport system permease small subunit